MKKYGLSEFDLNISQEKVDNQRSFLKNNSIITANGEVKSLLELSFSANHSERYYAQLANKINTLENIAFNNNLQACFLTITLDGFYRDLLKADYKRYDEFNEDKFEEIKKSTPNNSKLGFIHNKLENREALKIKDLYNILNHQMRQFRMGYAFKKLKKQNKKYIYIRTVEPHNDGVPHFHIMLFIPKDMIELFKKDFKKIFVAPQNSKPKLDSKLRPIPDTLKGFQTDIKSASAYILKYITKSFLDVKNNKDLDYLNAWFIKHRIMRCVTSRSTIPQWIFQKISVYEKDWYYLTDILDSSNKSFETEWNQEEDYFYVYDNWSRREFCYFCGELRVYSYDKLVHKSGTLFDKSKYKKDIHQKTPNKWTKKPNNFNVYLDTKLVKVCRDGSYSNYSKHISEYTDYELMQYYQNYDIDNENYTKYLATRNIMIDKGLLSKEKINLHNFNEDEFLNLNNSDTDISK